MVRRIRSNLETRSGRLALPVAKKPAFTRLGPGLGLGYRRNAVAGTWVVRAADGKGSNWTKAFATADDHEEANGQTILTYMQACDKARTLARSGNGAAEGKAVTTVADALDAYEDALEARGADLGNVSRARRHVPDALKRRPVALLNGGELRRWRDGLKKIMTAASTNRVGNAVRAALNLAADDNESLSRNAWETGLKSLPDDGQTDNVVLPDAAIKRAVREAYRESEEFGVFVEVVAVTGARPSQVCRIECRDAKPDCVMMPASRKGKPGAKKFTHRRVPVPIALAKRLCKLAKGRPERDPLLRKASGDRWRKSDHTRPFRRVAERAGLDPSEATIYALRHSSIVRQLVAGVPIRIVAVMHDTSAQMIEKHYSAHIDRHVDDGVVRAALLAVR